MSNDSMPDEEMWPIYTITVTMSRKEKVLSRSKWEIGAPQNDGSVDPNRYGYTPQIVEALDVEREIYKQQTQVLNLRAVINAVNDVDLPASAVDSLFAKQSWRPKE